MTLLATGNNVELCVTWSSLVVVDSGHDVATRSNPAAGACLRAQDSDVLTEAMKEFGEHFPGLIRPLIQERDEYMVFMLRLLASRCKGPICFTV